MAISVNTNVGAMMALQTLRATNSALETTQSRINTGLSVASTKDDSAKYTIAQQLRGDVGGLQAVTSSLNNAKSVTDVAVSGAEQISDILNKMKSKALEAQDADADSLTKINEDYKAYKEQITNIISSSNFNGVNLLSSDGGSVSALMSLQGGSGADSSSTTWEPAKLDVSNESLDTLVSDVLTSDLTSTSVAATAQGELETAFASVQTALSGLGSSSRRIDDQLVFTSKLTDTIESGIGNLVDADLAKESASLQALQVKQQLGVQALSIANQAPQTLLSLFR
jgi:flagellin